MTNTHLLLSGIQHFVYCKRQWGLIHIDKIWEESSLTFDGRSMHERVHDATLRERRGDKLIVRGLPVYSSELRLQGVCDIVEFERAPSGVQLHGMPGTYSIRVVEYKRGKPKSGKEDILQVAAQAMCIEEMMHAKIDACDLYYGSTHRRLEVMLSEDTRKDVVTTAKEMHRLWQEQRTPLEAYAQHKCNACSLLDICLPKTISKRSVSDYVKGYIHNEKTT